MPFGPCPRPGCAPDIRERKACAGRRRPRRRDMATQTLFRRSQQAAVAASAPADLSSVSLDRASAPVDSTSIAFGSTSMRAGCRRCSTPCRVRSIADQRSFGAVPRALTTRPRRLTWTPRRHSTWADSGHFGGRVGSSRRRPHLIIPFDRLSSTRIFVPSDEGLPNGRFDRDPLRESCRYLAR